MRLHKVCMSCTLDRVVLCCSLVMGEDRVVRSFLVWTFYVAASRYGLCVAELCTALRNHQVVPSVLLVDVRSLRPASACSVPYRLGLCQDFSCLRIDLAKEDASVSGAGIPASAVLVPEDRRVYAAHIHRDRVRPFSADVLGSHYEVADCRYIGRDHVELSVVIAESRGIDASV